MSARVMVLEDDVLIGIDLVEQLIESGFDAAGPYTSVDDAINAFQTTGCDIAVLDVNLGKTNSGRFAQALRQNGVPFVFLSGYAQNDQPVLQSGEHSICKPVHLPDLVRIMNGLLATSD